MASPPVRSAAIARDTNETKILLAINLDGGAFPDSTDKRLLSDKDGHATQASKSQIINIQSGIGFLDHMLHALAKHAGWSLALQCKGDLYSECSSYISSRSSMGEGYMGSVCSLGKCRTEDQWDLN